MKMRAAFIGLLGLTLIWAAPGQCQAQALPAEGFRLDNPALFHGPSLPSFFNSEAVFNNVSLGGTSASLPVPRSLAAPLTPTGSERSLLERLAAFVPKADYASGEVGFIYGRAAGKYGGDFKETYLIGEVGDEHFHISAGASFQDTNFHFRGR